MSNYQTTAAHPETGVWQLVDMLDDHFGRHQYGVRFPCGTIYRDDEVKFPSHLDFMRIQDRCQELEEQLAQKNVFLSLMGAKYEAVTRKIRTIYKTTQVMSDCHPKSYVIQALGNLVSEIEGTE